MSPSPKIKRLSPIPQSAGGSPPAAMPQQAGVQTPLSLSNAAIAADALRRGQINDLRNRYDSLRSFDERLAFLLSLTPEQQRAIAGGSAGAGASRVFEKIEKEHQPNWWLMEELASSTVMGAPLTAGGLAAGPIAAATSVAARGAFIYGIYGTLQAMAAAITGKDPQGKKLSEKEHARTIFNAASGLFGLGTSIVPALGRLRLKRESAGSSLGHPAPEATRTLVEQPRVAQGDAGSPALREPEYGLFMPRVKGQQTVNASREETLLFLRSMLEKREYIRVNVDGTIVIYAGDTRSVTPPKGPNVSETLHTHPNEKIAMFSLGDLITMMEGKYSPNTVHSVLGEKWPQTRSVLEAAGAEPPPLEVVRTFVEQRHIKPENVTTVKLIFARAGE
jgi:hypothetical protein